MIVRVDWFKLSSGKWYAGGEVEIDGAKLWRDHRSGKNEVAVAILQNQQVLNVDSIYPFRNFYTVVTQSGFDQDDGSKYGHQFCQHLFFPSDFPSRMELEGAVP